VKGTKSTERMDTAWPRLDLPNVLWFFGAITAAIASIEVLDKIPESHSDLWVLLASLGFLVAYALAAVLLYRRRLLIPAGLLATVSAAMVPAVGYAFTQLVDIYPDDPFFEPLSDFSGALFGIGVATAVVALTPSWGTSGDDRALSGVVSGAVAVAIGLLLDAWARRRDAFWFYVGGYFAIGAALIYYVVNGVGQGGGRGAWIALLVVGAIVLLGAAVLRRATWAAYGALGLYGALFHYLGAHDWMRYVLLAVSLAVFALGLAVVGRRPPAAAPAEPPAAPTGS
jgi:hypothetical protein